MAGSDITVTSLTATPTLRGTKLVATINDPRDGSVPNLAADAVEFYAATVNNFASATNVVEGPGVASGQSEASHEGLIEEQTYYYWARVRNKLGSVGAKFPISDTGGISAVAIGMSGLAYSIANGLIAVDDHSSDASVASGALRIAIKTANGNAPSPTDQAFIAFLNATQATGSYQIRTIDSQPVITVPSGATLGFPSNVPSRAWLIAFDDGNPPRLAITNCRGPNFDFVFPLTELARRSSTAIGTGSDSEGVIYSDVGVTSKPFRIIGYLEWTSGLATAGVWVKPEIVRLFGPGVPRPGEIVQPGATSSTAMLSGTTTIPLDATAPQITEGNLAVLLTIEPMSAANPIELDFLANVSYTVAASVIGAIFRDSDVNCWTSFWTQVGAADETVQLVFKGMISPADINSRTYSVRVGGSTAGRWTINGINNASRLGGMRMLFKASEIMA